MKPDWQPIDTFTPTSMEDSGYKPGANTVLVAYPGMDKWIFRVATWEGDGWQLTGVPGRNGDMSKVNVAFWAPLPEGPDADPGDYDDQ